MISYQNPDVTFSPKSSRTRQSYNANIITWQIKIKCMILKKCVRNQDFIFSKNGLTLTDLGQNRKLNGNKSDFKVSKTLMFLSREKLSSIGYFRHSKL